MIGPGRRSLCKTEAVATRHLSAVLLSQPRGRSPHTRHKMTAGNTGNTGNPPQQSVRSFFGNDLKQLEQHRSNSAVLPETCRKLPETAGYSLLKHSSSAGLAGGIAPSAKIL
jgi:hypothetical protein